MDKGERTGETIGKGEEVFCRIFDRAAAGMALVGADGCMLAVNPFLCELLGYSREELLVRELEDLASPVDLSSLLKFRRRVLEGEIPFDRFEMRLLHKSGRCVWCAVNVSRASDGDASQTSLVAIIEDISERKGAERTLRKNERRLRELSDLIPETIFETDLQGKLTYVNRRAFDQFGYSREAYQRGLNAFDMVVDEDRARMRENVDRVLRGEKIGCNEYTAQRRDGSAFPAIVHSSVLLEDGKPAGLRGVIVDVTAQKAAEQALRRERDKAQRYLDTAEVILVALDLDGKISLINENGARSLGYEKEELVGKDWFRTCLPSEIIEGMEAGYRRFLNGDRVFLEHHENPVVMKSGEERDISWHNSPLEDESGKILGILSAGVDVTEQKRVEAALRESEERYRVTIQSTPDAISITRVEDGMYLYVNDGFCRLSGYARDEIIGATPPELNVFVNPADREAFVGILEEKGEVNAFELQYRRKDGSIFDALLSARPLRYGHESCLVAVVKDVSSIKRTEQENARLEVQLQQAQKMEAIGTLAGGIAHDFNNILTAIIGYTEMAVLDAPEATQLEQNLKEALKAAHRAKELVRQILAFSRQREQMRKPMLVAPIVKEALKLLRATLPSTIEIREEIGNLGTVEADPTQIHQVLMNLCTNASHAMRERGGVLTVSLSKATLDAPLDAQNPDMTPGLYQKLTVSDTGHGMSPAVIKRIFDPYFTTKERGEGTGLGLAVVQGIVRNHGGAITVDSRRGKGSAFHVYLPLVEQALRGEERLAAPPPTGTERILLVDDEAFLTKITQQMLERLGYEVEARTSSMEALELFRTKPDEFDLVITDMTMPGMAGDHFAKELMKLRPDVPILLCTGFSEKMSEQKAREMGIKEFLMKPLAIRDLSLAVRRALGGG